MKRNLQALYDAYKRIQGDDPIPIGSILQSRICEHKYKGATMEKIVGLLREFTDEYETDGQGRNTRYTVGFTFNRVEGKHFPSGPYMAVLDFIEETCVCVMCWNKGKIEKVYPDRTDLSYWYDWHYSRAKELRARNGFSDSWKWEPLDVQVKDGMLITPYRSWALNSDQQYDIPWVEIDKTGKLSPIRGIDAVTTKQIAGFLNVSNAHVLACMREGYEESCFRSGRVGIVCVDAKEAVRKIDGAVKDDSGAALPLENGGTVHVANSKTEYFSRYATVWVIDLIKKRPDFLSQQAKMQKIVEDKERKQAIEEDLLTKYDCTWEQLHANRTISPIKGLNAVSRKQAAEYLGVSDGELQKHIPGIKDQLKRLGLFVASSKDIAQKVLCVKRNPDFSCEVLLDNGDWTHIPQGKYTFFTPPALARIADELGK